MRARGTRGAGGPTEIAGATELVWGRGAERGIGVGCPVEVVGSISGAGGRVPARTDAVAAGGSGAAVAEVCGSVADTGPGPAGVAGAGAA